MAKSATAELVFHTDVICGECPVWDDRTQQLYWADLTSGAIFTFDPRDGRNTRIEADAVLGALALREQGGLVLASQKGFSFFDPVTGEQKHLCDPEASLSENMFGDGKCDPEGRFWAGTYHQDISDPSGSLYSLAHDLTVKKQREGLLLSNGLAWSVDYATFYHIDSVARTLYAFDYDRPSGDISNGRVLRKFDGPRTLPDGMTIDVEGYLWVALFNGGKVLRLDPRTGETVFEVSVPDVRQVTSCTFGGRNFNELYITTAKEIGGPYGIPEAEVDFEKNAGGLFRIKLPFRGFAAARFKG